ncbi:MAG: hypothetical protein Q8J97_04215 [Flavobacteriaceae bacterium]|nr:hypothetical protein [Flavobacteriaceae bacterium]
MAAARAPTASAAQTAASPARDRTTASATAVERVGSPQAQPR